MTPSAYIPTREAQFAPLTEHDETVLGVADWLDAEGYTPAAAVLRAVTTRCEIVGLNELKDNPEVLAHLLDLPEQPYCRIFTSCYRAYWRPNGAGYTKSALRAGVFTFREAYEWTSHVGPEKGILYEIIPLSAARPERVSGWKS